MPTLKIIKEDAFCESDTNGPLSARVVAVLSGFTPTASSLVGQFTANEQAKMQATAIAGMGEGAGYPGYPASICACRVVRAEPTLGTNFRIVWEFERPTFTSGGAMNQLYVIDEQRTEVEAERVKLPHVDDGKALRVGFTDAARPENVIQPQTAGIVIRKPALQVILAGRFDQTPTYGAGVKIATAQGSVNHATWGGYDRGFWLFVGVYLHRDPGQRIRTLSAVLVNMLDEDWSTYVLVRHPSGITPPLDAGAVAGGYPLAAESYIRPKYQNESQGVDDYYRDTSGIIRIGQYPATNFAQVFAALDPL